MTGGGNDPGDACGCAENRGAEVEKLLGRNGQGELGDFLREVVADGTQVCVLGYADPPVGGNEFSGCMPCIRALDDRVKALPGVIHVPVHQAIDPADGWYYDADRVHPSLKASSVMAGLLFDAISKARQPRGRPAAPRRRGAADAIGNPLRPPRPSRRAIPQLPLAVVDRCRWRRALVRPGVGALAGYRGTGA